MKTLGALALTLAGAAFFLLGLLFVVAGGQVHRYFVGAVGLAAGAVLLGLGIRLFKQAEASSPDQVLAELLDLARRRNGELSEDEVFATLGSRAEVGRAVLARLVSARRCEARAADGGTFYVFKSLQPRLFVTRCEYCAAEVSIASEARKCPRCGGSLKTQVEARSVSGAEYRMDE